MTQNVFNTPFEIGLRMVYLLNSLYPRKVDLQKLIYLDYAVIYSADLGGPSSLHTPVPLRGCEYTSRREAIEDGLYLMATRGLIDIKATSAGINYLIGDNGPSLISVIGGSYSKNLQERCAWVANTIGDMSNKSLENIFFKNGTLWGAEFIESHGDEA